MEKNSYSSADIDIPVKLLHDRELVDGILEHKRILLRHLQLSVTNKCNLTCTYCSCRDKDKSLVLSLERILYILQQAKQVGCRAITITGGGEPLLHPDINDIIKECKRLDISVGLVTNGIAISKLEEGVRWCRISFDSDRSFSSKYIKGIEAAIEKFPDTDWAFSFVATNEGRKNNFGDLKKVVQFANAKDFTHIRVVADILHPNKKIIKHTRRILREIDEKVVYQDRAKPTRGQKKCWISLLKPVIGTDGKIYPCCGVQYAIKNTKNDFISRMSMGDGENLENINQQQECFNGSVCDICYYQGYNRLLSLLLQDLEHKEWV